MNSKTFFQNTHILQKKKDRKGILKFFSISVCGYVETKYFFQSPAAKIATLLKSALTLASCSGEDLC